MVPTVHQNHRGSIYSNSKADTYNVKASEFSNRVSEIGIILDRNRLPSAKSAQKMLDY